MCYSIQWMSILPPDSSFKQKYEYARYFFLIFHNSPLKLRLIEEFERGEGIFNLPKVSGRVYADSLAHNRP